MAFSCMECMRRFSQIVLIIINIIVVVSSDMNLPRAQCTVLALLCSLLNSSMGYVVQCG